MSHGSQGAAVQMAKCFLIRNELCKEAIDLLESTDIPQNISDLLTELLCLPPNLKCDKHKKGKRIADSGAHLLGRPIVRALSIHEDVAITNLLAEKYVINDLLQISTLLVSFYPKIALSDTIVFTTSSYKRVHKSMNHFCLLRDGSFLKLMVSS